MIQWVAAVLIVLGGGYLGVSYAQMEEKRIHNLEMLEQMLGQLEFNLVFLSKPFAEGLKSVAESYRGIPSRLFGMVAIRLEKTPNLSPEISFSLALEDVADAGIKQEEQEILREFFRHIGGGDCDTTRDGIRITSAKIRSLREQAIAEKEKDGKLWRSMGFLGGTLVVLLLM